MNIPVNHLKESIKAGKTVYGAWLECANPAIAEIAGLVGYDFVIIDQEHGLGDVTSAIEMMRALSGTKTTAVIRVPSDSPHYIKRILDAGAQALIIPMVDTAAQADAIVKSCYYPPYGVRGNAAPAVRASRYGLIPDYIDQANESLMIIPQIESVTAVNNAREIASVHGVDMVFIGPADLSGSAGFPSCTNSPEAERLIQHTFEVVKSTGKPVGTCPRDGKSVSDLYHQGFNLIAANSDINTISSAFAGYMNDWRRLSGDNAHAIEAKRYS